MKTGLIISGTVFLLVAILVIFADNVNIFGFIATANGALRNFVTVILVLLGVFLIGAGVKKARINN